MEWKDRPTAIEKFPNDVNYILGIDETGTASHKGIQRKLYKNEKIDINDKYFTLSGIVMHRINHRKFRKDIKALKEEYWENGSYKYKGNEKMICFHSREIRKKEGPFNKLDENKYARFIQDLSNFIIDQKFNIYSTTIDKEELCNKYVTPYPPYRLASEFLLERYCMMLNSLGENGIIMLESRGVKEDKFVLKHLIDILDRGNTYGGYSNFKRVKGIYFNPKWSINKNTYSILELADLVSYPIHKYVRSGFKEKDRSFQSIEDKISNFPDYFGKGLKVFPEKRKAATAMLDGRPGFPRSF